MIALLCVHLTCSRNVVYPARVHIYVPSAIDSLSKTTKLILLDSLLQEVCISSGIDGSLTLSSLGLSVCLSQSQNTFFRAKESLLINKIILYLCMVLCLQRCSYVVYCSGLEVGLQGMLCASPIDGISSKEPHCHRHSCVHDVLRYRQLLNYSWTPRTDIVG